MISERVALPYDSLNEMTGLTVAVASMRYHSLFLYLFQLLFLI